MRFEQLFEVVPTYQTVAFDLLYDCPLSLDISDDKRLVATDGNKSEVSL